MGRKKEAEGAETKIKNSAEKKIMHSEESYLKLQEQNRLVVENANEIILVVQDEKIKFFNPKTVAVTGYPASEIPAMHILEFIHREDRISVMNYYQSCIEGLKTEERYTMRVICRDNSIKHLEVKSKQINWEGRNAVLAFITDITEHRRSIEELKRLSAAIEQAGESVIIIDINEDILYINPAFEFITGFSIDEIKEKNLKHLRWDEAKPNIYEEIWKTVKSGNIWKGKITSHKKDGAVYHLEGTISPVFSEGGKISNFVSISRDITKETELESRLAQSQKMEAIGTLAGGIAHDFNNILNSIIGFSELAYDKADDTEKVKIFLSEVLTAGKRARELVKNILTFSRKSENELKPMLLQPVVKETLKLLKRSFPSTIEIKTAVDADCMAVVADVTQAQQVIMNLCTNAYHAMRDKGGKLKVSLHNINVEKGLAKQNPDLHIGKYVCLTVEDSGIGIDKSIIHRIFEPYFTTKKSGEGTGLGLSTVHGIIQNHNGAIMVDSHVNIGTIFDIYFPVYEAGFEAAAEDKSRDQIMRGSERILFVDDQEPITMLGKVSLEDLGYQVTTCSCSAAALDIFKENPYNFDLALTDQTMPKLTGADLAKEMLKIRSDMPIILCSGYTESINEEQALSIGIKKFMRKPMDRKSLAAAIREALEGK